MDLDFRDGASEIPDRKAFQEMAYESGMVMPHHEGLEFVKFQIVDVETDDPKLYFINTRTHSTHVEFMQSIGRGQGWSQGMRGVLVHRPFLMAPSGKPGLYTFEFELEDEFSFERIEMVFNLLEDHSMLLTDSLAYYLWPRAQELYEQEKEHYEDARIPFFFRTRCTRASAFCR